MQHKTQQAYSDVLLAVKRRCCELGSQPGPSVIITDFEAAAMNAARNVFADVGTEIRGCFFHLTQATWRKIQELGLSSRYVNEADFRHLCGMLDGIAFVPLPDVQPAFSYVKQSMPQYAQPLVAYFDATYVSGRTRQTAAGDRRIKPAFPPQTWNVFDATLSGASRTNNHAEAWNHHIKHLVGHDHPSVWRLLEGLQMDTAEASSRILRHIAGNSSPKRQSKHVKATNKRLKNLCEAYVGGNKPLNDFLIAVGHAIRLH